MDNAFRKHVHYNSLVMYNACSNAIYASLINLKILRAVIKIALLHREKLLFFFDPLFCELHEDPFSNSRKNISVANQNHAFHETKVTGPD